MTAPDSAGAAALRAGDVFPAFRLPDAEGKLHQLSDYAGKYVVLYVYPKDHTPGCTQEACNFRDSVGLRRPDVQILGLSMDDAASHQKFAEEYHLPFPLLSDPQATFLKEVGGYGPKQMFGKVSDGVKRVTFLIGPGGKLVEVWNAVKVEGHAEAVRRAIEADLGADGA